MCLRTVAVLGKWFSISKCTSCLSGNIAVDLHCGFGFFFKKYSATHVNALLNYKGKIK